MIVSRLTWKAAGTSDDGEGVVMVTGDSDRYLQKSAGARRSMSCMQPRGCSESAQIGVGEHAAHLHLELVESHLQIQHQPINR